MNTCSGDDAKGGTIPSCRFVNDAVGTRVGLNPKHCEICRSQGGTAETNMCRALTVNALAARIIAGDIPRYSAPESPIDVPLLFARFADRTTVEEQRSLIQKAFRAQARFAENEGGLPAAELAAKFVALAERFNLSDALEEVVYGHARSRA